MKRPSRNLLCEQCTTRSDPRQTGLDKNRVSDYSSRMEVSQLSDEELRETERNIEAQKREREHAKWDTELVGRYFRIIRTPDASPWKPLRDILPLDDYVRLERTLGVAGKDKCGHPSDYVFADVVYLHIQRRDDNQLACSGFEVSHAHREEPYLKIQPVFYSYADFRNYLGGTFPSVGPLKHFDEISNEEYDEALRKAVHNFSTETPVEPVKGWWRIKLDWSHLFDPHDFKYNRKSLPDGIVQARATIMAPNGKDKVTCDMPMEVKDGWIHSPTCSLPPEIEEWCAQRERQL